MDDSEAFRVLELHKRLTEERAEVARLRDVEARLRALLAAKDEELARLRAAYYRVAVQVNGLADKAQEVANE